MLNNQARGLGTMIRIKKKPVQGRNSRSFQGEGPEVATAVASTRFQGSQKPSIVGSSGGDLRIRVRFREYVADLSFASTAFLLTQYSINPGLSTLFPWLSQIAQLFESYKFNALKFQYRKETANTTLGKVMYCVDWDAADAAPTTKQLLLQERTKAEDAAWTNFELKCDSADLLKFGVQRYVRAAALAANLDIKTYDVGNLNVAGQGISVTSPVGELWVEYDVELITPNPSAGASAAGQTNSAKVTSGSAVSNTSIYGTSPVVTGSPIVTASGQVLTFPVGGQYLVETVGVGGLSAITLMPSAGTTLTNNLVAGGLTSGSSSNQWTLSYLITAAAGGTVTLSAPTGTVTSDVTRVCPYLVSLG